MGHTSFQGGVARKHSRKHTFALSLALSLFVFLTLAGCAIVDAQGRRLSFGDEQPPFQVEQLSNGKACLQVKLFGLNASWDVTSASRAWEAICDFCCIPHK